MEIFIGPNSRGFTIASTWIFHEWVESENLLIEGLVAKSDLNVVISQKMGTFSVIETNST